MMYTYAKVSKITSFKIIKKPQNKYKIILMILETPNIIMWNTSISGTNDMLNCNYNSDYPFSKSTNWLVAVLSFIPSVNCVCLSWVTVPKQGQVYGWILVTEIRVPKPSRNNFAICWITISPCLQLPNSGTHSRVQTEFRFCYTLTIILYI